MVEAAGFGLYFMLWSLPTIMVMLDADDRGENRWMWGAAVFVGGIFGLGLYWALVLSPDPDFK